MTLFFINSNCSYNLSSPSSFFRKTHKKKNETLCGTKENNGSEFPFLPITLFSKSESGGEIFSKSIVSYNVHCESSDRNGAVLSISCFSACAFRAPSEYSDTGRHQELDTAI